MDFFQTTRGRVLGVCAAICLWVVFEPRTDALSVKYNQKRWAKIKAAFRLSPDGELWIMQYLKMIVLPNTKPEEMEQLIDRAMDGLPGDKELRSRRDAMPSDLSIVRRNQYRLDTLEDWPTLPKRSLLYRGRQVLVRTASAAIIYAVSPPWLRSFTWSYSSIVLPNLYLRMLDWRYYQFNRGHTFKPALQSIYFCYAVHLLAHLYHWSPQGALPRPGIASVLYRFAGCTRDRRFFMFFDTFMTPSLVKIVLLGSCVKISPATLGLQLLDDLWIGWKCAIATRTLEQGIGGF